MVDRKKTDLTVMIENPFWRFVYRLFYATGIMDIAHKVSHALEETKWYPQQDAKTWRDLEAKIPEVERLAREGAYDAVEIHAIGQSHLDLAWLWRWVDTIEKGRMTFKNAIKHIKQYPAFTFSQPQAALYRWMELYHPAIFEQIGRAIRAGRWEVVGGEWVEMDANLPSGEALVRQRLYGQRYFLEKFGVMAEIGWLPDTFGYAWTYPQILAKSGARYFWTTKLTWNKQTRFPFRTFWWTGLDGTRILSHISTLGMHGLFQPQAHVESNRLLPEGKTLAATYATPYPTIETQFSGDHIRELGLFYGKGDGGHGPSPAEARFIDRLSDQGILAQTPAGVFFHALDQYGSRLPAWNDEMYLETHRGTLTTHGWVKRVNRAAEVLLEEVEKFGTFADLVGRGFPQREVETLWKVILFNQFHDVIPGSSIPEVYEEHRAEFETAFRQLHALRRDALAFLARAVNTAQVPEVESLHEPVALVVFNPLNWDRTDVVRARVPHQGTWDIYNADGTRVPTQKLVRQKDGHRIEYVVFVAEAVPALGYATYFLQYVSTRTTTGKNRGDPYLPVAVDKGRGAITIENEVFRVVVDVQTGYVDSIQTVNPNNEEESVELLHGYGNIMRAWKDFDDAWNIDLDYPAHEIPMVPPTGVRVSANGPVFTTVEVTRTFQKSKFIHEVTLYRGVRRVEFKTKVVWHEQHVLLKVGFETTTRTPTVTCEIPYGHIDRPTAPKLPQEQARWEFCGHKWVDLSDPEAGWGLMLVNDCKYGFSVERDGATEAVTLLMSLLRSPQFPFDQLPASIARYKPRPIFTDQGNHLIRYALVPHAGTWQDSHAWRAGWEFNYPLVGQVVPPARGFLPPNASFLTVSQPNVFVGAVKPPEARIFVGRTGNDTVVNQLPDFQTGIPVVVRLVEIEGRETRVALTTNYRYRVQAAYETDLLELSPQSLEKIKERDVEVNLRPHEIKTVVLIVTPVDST